MKSVITWILIADGARARILANNGPNKGVVANDVLLREGDHRPSRELMSDRPGRTFESVGSLRHAKQPPLDAHDKLKTKFAHTVATALERHADSFDRLIIVAPPAALGELRKSLSREVSAKVSHEVGKDLTQTPNAELPKHLEGVIAL